MTTHEIKETLVPQGGMPNDDEPDACEACGEALQLGDPVYWGDGLLHALCCGPERDGFYNADGNPLAEGEPIPRPMIWNGEQGVAELASDARNDEVCVDRFALAMQTKLSAARCKGRAGWDDPARCSMADLSAMLVEHVAKGDPVDVANFAMMIHNRGGRIETPAPQAVLVLRAAIHEAVDLLMERTHGNAARSPAHNARLRLQAALAATEGSADV